MINPVMLIVSAFLVLAASGKLNETENQPQLKESNQTKQGWQQEAVGFGPFWSEYDMWI